MRSVLLPGAALAILSGCGLTASAVNPDVIRAQSPTTQAAPAADNKVIQQTTFEADKLPGSALDKPSTVKIVARVNDKVILDEEVRDAVMPMLLGMPPEERSRAYHTLYSRELQKIIDRELVIMDLTEHFGKSKPQYIAKLKEAASAEFRKYVRSIKDNMEKKGGVKVKSDEELYKLLRASGLNLDGYRRHQERNYMSMEYLKAIIFPMVRDSVNRQEIVDYYTQHAADFETVDRVHWQHIFIDASQYRGRQEAATFAYQIAERARRGEDFTKLVKEYDNGDAAWRGGEGVWSTPTEVQPHDLSPVLFRMRPKEVGPVIEVANGFHIVRLLEREHAGRKPLDDKLQTEIRRKLQGEIAEREMRRVISEFRRKAAIDVIEADSLSKSE